MYDVRPAVLAHMPQRGNPTPFDRTLAVSLAARARDELDAQFAERAKRGTYVGMNRTGIAVGKLSHMDEEIDMSTRLPYHQWWRDLVTVLYTVADKDFDVPLEQLPIYQRD